MSGRDHSAPSGIPDVLLERYLSDDLEPEARERIAARLEGSPEIRARLDELSVAREAFLNANPPAMFAHRVAVEVAVGEQVPEPQSAKSKLWLWLVGPAGLAATGLILAITFGVTGEDQATDQFNEVARTRAPEANQALVEESLEEAEPMEAPESAAGRALRAQDSDGDWKPLGLKAPAQPQPLVGDRGALGRSSGSADKAARRGTRGRLSGELSAKRRANRPRPKSAPQSAFKISPARRPAGRAEARRMRDLAKEQEKFKGKAELQQEERAKRQDQDDRDREADGAAPQDAAAPPSPAKPAEAPSKKPTPTRAAPQTTAPSSAPVAEPEAEPMMDRVTDEDEAAFDEAAPVREEKKDVQKKRNTRARKAKAVQSEAVDSIASKSSSLGGASAGASSPAEGLAMNKQAASMSVTWLLPKGGKVRAGAVLDGGQRIQMRGVLQRGYAAVVAMTASGEVRFTQPGAHKGGTWTSAVTLPKVSRDTVARVFVLSSPKKFGLTKASLRAQGKKGLPNRLALPSGAQQRSLRIRLQAVEAEPAAESADSP